MTKLILAASITLVSILGFYLLADTSCLAEGGLQATLARGFWLSAIALSALIRLIGYSFIERIEE